MPSYRRPLALRKLCVPILAWPLVILSLAGCGYEEYERRLEATRSYYAYQDRLDQNLAPPWRSPPIDSLRVPLQFKEIAALQPAEGVDESTEDESTGTEEADPRQPDYARISIPGLIGAWRADVDVTVGDQRLSLPVYLYAATNHYLLLADRDAAVRFTQDLEAQIEAALQTSANRLKAEFPKGHQYTPRLTFDNSVLISEVPIHDARYVAEIYAINQQDNQVALVIVRPDGMDPMSKISDRIQLMLETLKVSAAAPQRTQTAPPTGSQPAGPAPSTGGF